MKGSGSDLDEASRKLTADSSRHSRGVDANGRRLIAGRPQKVATDSRGELRGLPPWHLCRAASRLAGASLALRHRGRRPGEPACGLPMYRFSWVAGAVRDGTGAWLRRRRKRGAVEGT
jgi:hypothetical protein